MANYFAILSVSLQDEVGVDASFPIYLRIPEATTVTQIIAAANTLALDVDAVSGAKITDVRVSIDAGAIAGSKTGAVAGSRVEQNGLFNFAQQGIKYKWPENVPAIADTVLVNGRIDLTNAAIIAFHNAMSTIITGIVPISKWGFIIEGLIDVATTFRKHRRQMIKDTFEENN